MSLAYIILHYTVFPFCCSCSCCCCTHQVEIDRPEFLFCGLLCTCTRPHITIRITNKLLAHIVQLPSFILSFAGFLYP